MTLLTDFRAYLPTTGFWGTPTSSVDWCEANYAHTPYVCELFNTVSSLAMVVVGLAGTLCHRRLLERRFLGAFFLVALVGLGSIAFHGTLRFELQMLDELPMLYTVILMAFILLEQQPGRRFGAWLPRSLVTYAVFVTYLAAFTRGRLQFYLFQVSFGSLEFWCLYQVYRLFRASQSSIVRRWFLQGVSLYAGAMILWFSDLRFCDVLAIQLPAHGMVNPQLHAWWHVLVSGGFYLLLLLLAYDRQQRLGHSPRVAHYGFFFPYLQNGQTE